ncbi:unnamed protein product [Polarella glacialis]|uniref:Uncharacterized protein n=1 Tax=Polarella glacialis TaxID=89957 RepID=A0A813H317_POLGL|nr:unnamed protein product [Polarella glacialis]
MRAEELYSRACTVHAVLCEPLHPFLTCIHRKLATVRLRLLADKLEDVDQFIPGSLVVLRGGLPEGVASGSVGMLGAIANSCPVHLPDRELQVHAANLSTARQLEGPPELGQLVLVHGLRSKSGLSLNGRIGTVEGSSSDGGSVSVRGVLSCGGLANLPCKNLCIVNSLNGASGGKTLIFVTLRYRDSSRQTPGSESGGETLMFVNN